jgi:hypothetical protein
MDEGGTISIAPNREVKAGLNRKSPAIRPGFLNTP